MATMLDLRRTDQRTVVLATPFWLESATFGKECDDKAAVLFSFPAAKGVSRVIVHDVAVQIVTAFAGGTITLDIGTYSIPLETTTTAGTATVIDIDDFIPTASITSGTAGWYVPAGGDFLTAKAAGTLTGPALLTPADSTVPTVAVTLTSDAAITAGAGKLYMLVSYLP